MANDLISRVVHFFADIGVEITEMLKDPDGYARLMGELGLVPAGGPPTGSPNAGQSLSQLRDRAAGPDANSFEQLVDLSTAMVDLTALIQQFAGSHSVDDALNFLATLVDVVALDRLRRDHLEVVAVMRAMHLLSDNRILIGDLVRARSEWGSFMLGNPPDDDAAADNASLIVGALLAALGKWIPPADDSGQVFRVDMLFGWDPTPGSAMPRAERALQRMATVRLTPHAAPGAPFVDESFGLSMAMVPPADGGWGLFMALDLGAGLKFPIGKSLRLSLSADSPSAVQAFFGKSSFVRSGASNTTAKLTLARKAEIAEHLTFGSDTGLHFEVGKFSTGFELVDPPRFRFTLADAALVLPSKSLGFIGSVLPSGGIKFNVDIDISLDTTPKLSFTGGAGFTVTLPVNRSLAILEVRSVTVGLAIEDGPKGAAGALSAVVAFGLAFGKAFKVNVDGIGAKLLWTLPSTPARPDATGHTPPAVRGNLGPAGDLSLAFVPPLGIGVVIDVGPIRGGGFFYLDPVKRTYAGVLEAQLNLCGKGLQIKAAGLLRETDDGWDFVLVLSAQIRPAPEIFLGLTLNGVGGMLGINVSVDVAKLRGGLRDGAMGRLLFPDDPVANAPAIIATLASVFPHQRSALVAGPMLQLGWGRPNSFVTLSMAVVVALPSPALLIIMGRLMVQAPTPELPVVNLKADFLGIIDFEKPALSFDASIVDSKVGMFPINGDMALRAGPEGFLLSIGGFHPAFHPPADLATMRRISLDITPNPVTKIRCDGYLAVTSNTFQIGLHAQLDIDVRVASIHGWIEFDALVQWAPRFWFSVRVAAGLEFRVAGRCLAGISLELLLEGPGLWHAKGQASLHILFFTIHAGFDVTWGEAGGATDAPQIDAAQSVAAALAAPGAWSSVAPDGDAVATYRDVQRDTVAVDPDGRLKVRQQAVPLGIPITRVGLGPVVGGSVTITLDVVAGGPPSQPSLGQFAAAQFMDLSDDEKLSRPSFESYQDGVVFGADDVAVSKVENTQATYETVFIPEQRPRVRAPMHAGLLFGSIAHNAVGRSGLHFATLHDGPEQRVRVTAPGFRVVDADTLAPVASGASTASTASAASAASAAASFGSAAAAYGALNATRKAASGTATSPRLMVVADHEMVT
ncbi:MAG: hypothetical protein JWQ11_3619 [Rhizobacter sp.]|nr:hypothetical protein [Rhizobacter sp.]